MKHIGKIIRNVILFLILIGVAFVSYLTIEGYQMYREVIKDDPLKPLIASIQSREDYVTLKQVPTYYQDAVVAVEDHRFYKHHGIDIMATFRAFYHNFLAGSLQEGGSGITQQLSKNLYFTQEKKWERKIAELFMSFHIEKEYSKKDILELYINTIYYGNGYYGIKEASQAYYQKEPSELSLSESTLLAGIPNAPSVYSLGENKELAYQRQRQVLKAMVKYNYLEYDQIETVMSEKVSFISW